MRLAGEGGLVGAEFITANQARISGNMIAFSQEWHVEEERPLDSGPDTGPRSDDEWIEDEDEDESTAPPHAPGAPA